VNVQTVPISTLSLDPANVRRHPERNMDAIMGSLKRFGQQKPIVVDAKGVVIAGNGTLAAAKQLGWKEIAVVRSDLIGSDATAFAIADNRAAELAEWDDDALAKTLAALQIEDEALAKATGFDDADIERIAGVFDVRESDAPSLRDGDREPFRQMAFILHDDQHERVEQAIAKAKQDKSMDCSQNENSNGNAIAHICGRFLHG
jgi:ParB-like chromosome segregation protein Spo0J